MEIIDLWAECRARAIVAAGGPGLNSGSHKVGCLTLPISSGNTRRQIQFMVVLGPTIRCCTPAQGTSAS